MTSKSKMHENYHKMPICIVCGTELPGLMIKDAKKIYEEDIVLVTLRKIKNIIMPGKTGIHQLYVCNNCLDRYKEKRKRYESTMNTIIVIAVLLSIIVIILPLMYVRLPDLVSVIFSVVFLLMFVVLATLSYVPPLEESKHKNSSQHVESMKQSTELKNKN
ncbi:MAG: hypothetical protein N3E37_01280 [Candidatus Micrarchaeota archaeon]|nr:hypothetical protein [Candidatus Micrarchaeota archaeon]